MGWRGYPNSSAKPELAGDANLFTSRNCLPRSSSWTGRGTPAWSFLASHTDPFGVPTVMILR